MDIEMFGQLLPEQANAPDSAATYGFAGPVTGTLPPLLSHQLIPNLGHAIKGPFFEKAQWKALANTPSRRWSCPALPVWLATWQPYWVSDRHCRFLGAYPHGTGHSHGKGPSHLQIAGEDQKFLPATGRIEGDSLVVHSDEVSRPMAVRYAWSEDALPNLMNREGLPASPFRTDSPKK